MTKGKIYFLCSDNKIKIGYTKGSIEKRIQQLNTGSPNKIYKLGWIEGDKEIEKQLHIKFSEYRIRSNGEWFLGNQKIIDYINEVNQEPNIYIDIVDNKILPLLKLSL
jgi:hypothetical protein